MPAQSHITIIYASTSGNVETVVESIAKYLEEMNISSSLHRAEQTDSQVIIDNTQFIFATSTWEHGELNPFFNKLLKEMDGIDCSGKSAGFVGLGDMRYEPALFNVGIDIVKNKFIEKKGAQVHSMLKINGEPYEILEKIVKPWTLNFKEKLHVN